MVHSFCAECWTGLHFLGNSGCARCGLPLEATDAEECGACLAKPPRIGRSRAAVAYGDISRGIALKLKYGRKVAVARTMAKYMVPLIDGAPDQALLVPVPLHRGRLWNRGFNQAMLVAAEMARSTGLPLDREAVRRTRRTPPLGRMSRSQRRRAVAGAFTVIDPQRVRGRNVVLVDDILTTGSTANACARALLRAGAARVDLVAWARVVRPTVIGE